MSKCGYVIFIRFQPVLLPHGVDKVHPVFSLFHAWDENTVVRLIERETKLVDRCVDAKWTATKNKQMFEKRAIHPSYCWERLLIVWVDLSSTRGERADIYSRKKMEGMNGKHEPKWGAERRACYVTQHLSYDLEGERNGWAKKIYGMQKNENAVLRFSCPFLSPSVVFGLCCVVLLSHLRGCRTCSRSN